MNLHELSPAPGSTQVGKRKGRGPGTGNGKTAGRGPCAWPHGWSQRRETVHADS